MNLERNAVTDQSLQINFDNYAKSSTSERRFVHLTQPVESGMDKTASMFDISQMISFARIGLSAFSYKKNSCPANVTATGVQVRLDFEAWPSSKTLEYILESNIGHISSPTIISEYTSFSVVFGKTDVVELDFILESISSQYWETSCYSVDGEQIPDQIVTLDGDTTLRTDIPIFGVLRITGKKIGARHRVTHTLIKSVPFRPESIPDADLPEIEDKTQEETADVYWGYTDVVTWDNEPVDPLDSINLSGLSITNLQITIRARWVDTEGNEQSESMSLTIPQCVKDLLSMCDGEGEEGNIGVDFCKKYHGKSYDVVYYSTCSGNVLQKRTVTPDDDWCI